MRDGKEGQFQAGRDAGLVEDVGEVALDGLFAQIELPGNVPIAATLDDATHHFKLTVREAISLARGQGGLLHQVVKRGDKIAHALAADPVVAGEDDANGGLEMAGKSVLDDNAAGANLQRLNDLLSGDGGG